MHVGGGIALTYVWRSEDEFVELVLSFHFYVGSRAWTTVPRLVLNHLAGLHWRFADHKICEWQDVHLYCLVFLNDNEGKLRDA